MSLVSRARLFATTMHCDQVRKWTGEPYITHPEAVAELVADLDTTQEMIAAAWLHDTVEDTDATIPQILFEFGPIVADYVWDLTKPHVPRYPQSETIKLADIIDNTETIVERAGVGFAREYLKKKQAQVLTLTRGDPALLECATLQIEEGLRRLGI